MVHHKAQKTEIIYLAGTFNLNTQQKSSTKTNNNALKINLNKTKSSCKLVRNKSILLPFDIIFKNILRLKKE